MRVLFLDVDGVLNGIEWFSRRGTRGGIWPRNEVDPHCVDLLNELVVRVDTQIVLSSTWRIAGSLERSKKRMREIGVHTGRMIGITPRLPYPGRGAEIETWLLTYEAAQHERPAFVILDDDDDMGPHLNRLVQTDHRVGLTEEDCDRVAALFGDTA